MTSKLTTNYTKCTKNKEPTPKTNSL